MEGGPVHQQRQPRRPTKYAGLSMKERAAARRHELIEAGIDLMGTVGIAHTKVSDICSRAGLTERYFYESFATLDHFTRTVVETTCIRAGVRIATAALAESGVREQGHAIIRECLAIVAEDARVGRLVLVETLRAGGELSRMRTGVLIVGANLLKQTVESPEGLDMQDLLNHVLLAGLGAEALPPLLTEATDPLVLALGGAVSEVLVGWAENRIDMAPRDLSDFLSAMLDAAIQAVTEGRSQAPTAGTPRA